MSYLTKNITLHQALSGDNPCCLYCQSKCIFNSTSSTSHAPFPGFTDVYKLTCEKCDEIFKIEDKHDKCVSFLFSCNDLIITIYYETENFSLEKRNSVLKNLDSRIWINELSNINLDFSNKDKMYNKLKTYAVMA